MNSDWGTINGGAAILGALTEMKRLQAAVLVVNKKDQHDEYGLIPAPDSARQVLNKDMAPGRTTRASCPR